jgi:hypothetical protein
MLIKEQSQSKKNRVCKKPEGKSFEIAKKLKNFGSCCCFELKA